MSISPSRESTDSGCKSTPILRSASGLAGQKRVLILGGCGFIGGHLALRLKTEGHHVTVVDIQPHPYFSTETICDQFHQVDLRDPSAVEDVIGTEVDELYQLAADMGGAAYIFTGENDAEVIHNSGLINLNVVKECVRKRVKKVFFASSACVYPEHNQRDPANPNCVEDSVYPAAPDSEYGWEKLFAERLYRAFARNHGLDVRIARFHNIFGPQGTWTGGREKAPAAMLRKAAEAPDGGTLEVWGNGQQTRSFFYVDECVEAVLRLMSSNFPGPVNIGSDQMISLNQLAELAITISGKNIRIHNLFGRAFEEKYGFVCPLGVQGRNSDNCLFFDRVGWKSTATLEVGLRTTYEWIRTQVEEQNMALAMGSTHQR